MNKTSSNYSALFDLIGVLARKRLQAGERAFATLNLNHTEARLLTLLDQHGGAVTQDELSSKVHIDRSNAGRALKGLEQAGLIVRTTAEANKRTKVVQITAKGGATVTEIAALRRRMAETFFGELTEEQAGVVVNHLGNIGTLERPTFGSGEGE